MCEDGLPDTVVDELVEKEWGTRSSSGSRSDDIFVKEVITPVLGTSACSDLHFESYTSLRLTLNFLEHLLGFHVERRTAPPLTSAGKRIRPVWRHGQVPGPRGQ